MTHQLKIPRPHFDAVEFGQDRLNIQDGTRKFQVGDYVVLTRVSLDSSGNAFIETNPDTKQPTRFLMRQISYVLPGGQFGLEPGYVCLGLKDADGGTGETLEISPNVLAR